MNYKIVEQQRIFSKFFKIDEVIVDHDRFRKPTPLRVRRFHLERPEAVAVLLENTSNNKIILVEQFRYSSIKLSQTNGWAREIIAGLVDQGENPEECGIRETMEETGYRVSTLQHISTYFASIGISDEVVHLYYGTVTDEHRIEQGGGLEDENEDLRVLEVDFESLFQEIQTGGIRDSKTIMAIQWLALKKGLTLK